MYKVTYLAREQGAIGKFYPMQRESDGNTALQAMNEVRNRLNQEGYETLHCVMVQSGILDVTDVAKKQMFQRNQ